MTAVRPGSAVFIALIAGMMTMTAMTIDINLPAIPAIAADLGSSLSASQLTVTVFFLGFAVGQLVWGPLADRFGRKPTLLVGSALYVATTLGCALAPSIDVLLTMRALEGFSAGAGAVLGRVIVRDLFEGAEMARIMSLSMALFLTAPLVAPSIGAVIVELASWRWVFGFLVIYGLLILVSVVLLLDETLPHPKRDALSPGPLISAFLAVFRDPTSRLGAIVATLGFGTLIVYVTNSAAVLMDGYRMTPAAFGVLFSAIVAFMIVGTLANSRLVRRFELTTLLRAGLLLAVPACALGLVTAMLDVGGPWAVAVGLSLYFLAFGLIGSNATTMAMQPHGAIAGSAAAAIGFTQSVVPAVVASIVAALYDGTARPMLAAMLLLSAVSLALVLRRRP